MKKEIRFSPDGDEVAFISFNLNTFQKDLPALILNESLQGVCLVVSKVMIPTDFKMELGSKFMVKIGAMDPMASEVKWVKSLDESVLKIGILLI
jgi:hypothetical protein